MIGYYNNKPILYHETELKKDNFDRVHRAKVICPIAKLATLKSDLFPTFSRDNNNAQNH